ncbi:MAG: NAD-dependent epimerase [Chloroflexi bacterium]|nr:NAD-dependent epimerase [Chloroflexota bacterium]|tara:strand:+ start:366 stop:1151 length:786 start_codon:yes stop_codon:yes gene_type:complete
MKKILITGGAGLVGSILIEGLKNNFEIRILDQKAVEGIDSRVGDISNLESILPAFENIDTVVHLAGDRRVYGDWDSILNNNITGIYNIYEAARINGVERIVFASSQHATGGFYDVEPWSFINNGEYEKLPDNYKPLDETCRIRPDSYYGASKSFGESLGSYYSDFHNLSTIHVRIGWVISDDDPTFSPISLNLWLSHKDICQIIELSVNADKNIKYDVFYATSDNHWKIWSIDKAKNILGYKPKDGAGSTFNLRDPNKADT